jgi:hypothetical protein
MPGSIEKTVGETSGASSAAGPSNGSSWGREADAVSETVSVRGPSAVRLDDPPGGAVEIPPGWKSQFGVDRRLELGDRGGLCARDDVVYRLVPFGRVADEQGPGHVAPMPVDLCLEVEQDDLALADHRIRRRAVRHRRVRPGEAGRIERDCLGTAGPEEPLEIESEVPLGRAGPDLWQECRQGSVGDPTCRGNSFDLARLLDRPIRLDPALDGDELDVRRGALEASPHGVREHSGLDPHSARTNGGDELRPGLGEIARTVDDAAVGHRAPGLDGVARVGKHNNLIWDDEELAGRSRDLLLARSEREPGEVPHVLRAQPEIGVDAGSLEPIPEARETSRSCRLIGLEPASVIGRRGRRGKVLRLRHAAGHFEPYLAMFALCSAIVFA